MATNGRICLECVHCWVSSGDCGYGEMTPSTPFEFYCTKGHNLGFSICNHDGDKASMLKGLRTAETCKDFLLEITNGN